MEIIKNIAAVVGCMTACIGLIVTLFRPIRKAFIAGITHRQKEDEASKKLNQVSQDISALKANVENLNDKVEDVKDKVLENEKDRLKSELARYAAMCRRGQPIHESDYLHVQEVYEKYHSKLNGNHTGTDDFNTIKYYFEKQNNIK